MLAAAQRAGVTHLVGHEFRWAPDRALVARAIADGAIGEPRTFSLVPFVPLVADPAAAVPQLVVRRPRGGGWLGASGSHVVDQVRTWLGEIASVSAALPTVSARTGRGGHVRRAGHDPLGRRRACSSRRPRRGRRSVVGLSVVAGTEGTIEVTADGVFCSDRSGRRELVRSRPTSRSPRRRRSPDDPRERYTHLELGPYTRLAEALRAGVEGRTIEASVPLPTFADGVAEMRVMDAIRASAAAGGALVSLCLGRGEPCMFSSPPTVHPARSTRPARPSSCARPIM